MNVASEVEVPALPGVWAAWFEEVMTALRPVWAIHMGIWCTGHQCTAEEGTGAGARREAQPTDSAEAEVSDDGFGG